MIQRCTNPNNNGYGTYGGRGIKVCDDWRRFKNFLRDMGVRPDGLSIDRIDSNGNYEPSNCRWSTNKEQGTNKSSNTFIEYQGVTKTITDWAAHIGVKPITLNQRLIRGWTIERVLTQKKQKYNKGGEHMAETYTCKRCDHTWRPRTDKKPLACPGCKQYQWDEERKPKPKKED
jgi:predicted Zn-ribbon and HTH transcriptional regulator